MKFPDHVAVGYLSEHSEGSQYKSSGYATGEIEASEGAEFRLVANESFLRNLDNISDETRQRITRLDLNRTGLHDDDLRSLGEWPNLKILSLRDTRISDASLGELSRYPKLSALDLSATQVTGKGFAAIEGKPGLEALILNHLELDEEGTASLNKFSQLKCLRLTNTDIQDIDLDFLQDFSDLRDLSLPTRVSDNSVKNLESLHKLKFLSFEACDYTAISLFLLKKLENIEWLELPEYANEEDLWQCAQWMKLKTLLILSRSLEAPSFAALEKMENLKELHLWCPVELEHIQMLSLAPALERLSLNNHATDLTHICELKHLKSLKHLRIDIPRVNESNAWKFFDLKHLESLHLCSSDFSSSGFLGFLPHMGNCRVTHAPLLLPMSSYSLKKELYGRHSDSDSSERWTPFSVVGQHACIPIEMQISYRPLSWNISDLQSLCEAKASSVVEFKVEGISVEADHVEILTGFRNLRSIEARVGKHNEEFYDSLGQYQSLQKVSFRNSNFLDRNIGSLLDCPLLEDIDIAGTKTTMTGWRKLKDLKSLRRLDLSGCDLTDSAEKEIRELLPGVNIILADSNYV